MKLAQKGLGLPDERYVWLRRILVVIIIVAVVYGVFHYGIIRKDCEQNKECFYEAAKTCKPAKLINVHNGNFYDYVIKGKRGESCLVYIRLNKMAPGSSLDQKALFEGKDMSCRVPLGDLEITDFTEFKGFMTHCHGNLKEAIFEQIIVKMYGLVIQNLGEIIDDATGAL